MINKKKLEIIDKVLHVCYETINLNIDNKKLISKELTTNFKDITQAIYNLESTKLLLEPIENNLDLKKHYYYTTEDVYLKTTYDGILNSDDYICSNCKKEIKVYGEFIDGKCLKCNQKLVKKEH